MELKTKIKKLQKDNKATIERLEHHNEETIERLREEYSQEIQSLVQMLKEEKQKTSTKHGFAEDKSQEVVLQDDIKHNENCDEGNGKINEGENISPCPLNEFDIDDWRRKEVKWEECKKTLENTIHELKQEIKEQNEFLELKKKGE